MQWGHPQGALLAAGVRERAVEGLRGSAPFTRGLAGLCPALKPGRGGPS